MISMEDPRRRAISDHSTSKAERLVGLKENGGPELEALIVQGAATTAYGESCIGSFNQKAACGYYIASRTSVDRPVRGTG